MSSGEGDAAVRGGAVGSFRVARVCCASNLLVVDGHGPLASLPDSCRNEPSTGLRQSLAMFERVAGRPADHPRRAPGARSGSATRSCPRPPSGHRGSGHRRGPGLLGALPGFHTEPMRPTTSDPPFSTGLSLLPAVPTSGS